MVSGKVRKTVMLWYADNKCLAGVRLHLADAAVVADKDLLRLTAGETAKPRTQNAAS